MVIWESAWLWVAGPQFYYLDPLTGKSTLFMPNFIVVRRMTGQGGQNCCFWGQFCPNSSLKSTKSYVNHPRKVHVIIWAPKANQITPQGAVKLNKTNGITETTCGAHIAVRGHPHELTTQVVTPALYNLLLHRNDGQTVHYVYFSTKSSASSDV